MKQIKLSITENYVSHWSWWQGARELMQNAIDTEDFNIYFGNDDSNQGKITIISRGGVVPVSGLLMGVSTKRDDDSKIGKFGEGLKVGLLVLVREGADIVIENGNDLWIPNMVYDTTYEQNILAVDIHENALSGRDSNTVTVIIENIPQYAMSEIMDNYAPTTERTVVIQNDRGKAYTKLYNAADEYQNEEEDGSITGGDCNLFVNGLFVTRVPGNFKFDYDFKPEAFTLDRDRDSANTFEVKYEANRLLSESDDIELLARLALEQYDDLALFSERRAKTSGGYYWGQSRSQEDQDDLTKTAVKLFAEKYGKDSFPIDDSWTDGKKRVVTQMAITKGYTPVTVKNPVYRMVQKEYAVDESVQEVLSFKPLEFLEGFLKRHERRLVAKPRKELEKTIKMLRIAGGKE
ncbi:hypothetical protein A71_164 [Escherichia phage A7_1]|nr:hypothetical protein A71_164 [Escherichia phage A7_1]